MLYADSFVSSVVSITVFCPFKLVFLLFFFLWPHGNDGYSAKCNYKFKCACIWIQNKYHLYFLFISRILVVFLFYFTREDFIKQCALVWCFPCFKPWDRLFYYKDYSTMEKLHKTEKEHNTYSQRNKWYIWAVLLLRSLIMLLRNVKRWNGASTVHYRRKNHAETNFFSALSNSCMVASSLITFI